MTHMAELCGTPEIPPVFSTLTEMWLHTTPDPQLGITFHHMDRPPEFYSYFELLQASKAFAVALKSRGIVAGDRVALILPTSVDFIIAYFGSILLKAIPVPLYPPMGLYGFRAYLQRMENFIDLTQPRALITIARLKSLLAPLFKQRTSLIGAFEVPELQGDVEDFQAVIPLPHETAFVQFSSGTTSTPKPVALSHRNLMANATAIGHRYEEGMLDERINFSWLPLYHDMGLIGNVLVPALWNCRNHLLPPQDFVARPWLWLQLLSETRAAFSSAPNFAYGLCLKRIQDHHMEKVNLSSWRWGLNGAEPINPELISQFEKRFARWGLNRGTIIPAYGLAESSVAVCIGMEFCGLETLRFNKAQLEQNQVVVDEEGIEIASAGSPIRGTHIRIANPEKSEDTLAENQVGEVLVKSPSVMEGYLNPQGQVIPRYSEWLSTGDLGFIHDGKLYLSGRKKDILIYHGRNLYPHHLEDSIMTLEGVRKGGCVVVAENVGSTDMIWAFVEVSDPIWASQEAQEKLSKQIRHIILNEHQVALDQLVLLEKYSVLRTSSGKIRRHATLEHYHNKALSSIRKPDYWAAVKQWIKGKLNAPQVRA